MGYRSYGNLVFPAKYLPLYFETLGYQVSQPQECKDNLKGDFWEITAWKTPYGVDMIRLAYEGWKYAGEVRLQEFMSKVNNLDLDQDQYQGKKFFSIMEEIPEALITTLKQEYKAINSFKIGKAVVPWEWGYNRQGEEDGDYDQEGNSENLWRDSDINWGHTLAGDLEGPGWVFGMEVTEKERKRMEEVVKLPRDADTVFKQLHDDSDGYFFLYKNGYEGMPQILDLKTWFGKYLGQEAIKEKDKKEKIMCADVTESFGTYTIEGRNYWDWDIYTESFPAFDFYGTRLDLDEMLQSYMKVAKDE